MSDEYAVGYKKPPVTTRFQKGQSGNPAGRKPKPVRKVKTNMSEVVADAWSKPVEINGNSLSAIEVVVRTVIARAIKGDNAAVRQVIELSKRYPIRPSYKGGSALNIPRVPAYLREIKVYLNQAKYRGGTEKESYTVADVPADMLERAIAAYAKSDQADEDPE